MCLKAAWIEVNLLVLLIVIAAATFRPCYVTQLLCMLKFTGLEVPFWGLFIREVIVFMLRGRKGRNIRYKEKGEEETGAPLHLEKV